MNVITTKCPHCPFTTRGAAALANHIKSKHPEHFIRKGPGGEQKKRKGGRPLGSKNKKKQINRAMTCPVHETGGVKYCPRCGLDLQAIQHAMETAGADNALASRVMDRLRTLKGNP